MRFLLMLMLTGCSEDFTVKDAGLDGGAQNDGSTTADTGADAAMAADGDGGPIPITIVQTTQIQILANANPMLSLQSQV